MVATRLVCLWPGLPTAWYRGVGVSTFIAVAFAWLVCLVLLATFVWPAWFAPIVVRALWLVMLIGWAYASVANNLRFSTILQPTGGTEVSQVVSQAQQAYLQGNWFDAEALLLDIVHRYPRDAEALLLLVGVLRHSKRWQPALRRLEQLRLLESADRWRYEIEREADLIQAEMAEELDRESTPAE